MDFFPVLPVLSSSFLVGRVDSGDHKLSLMWSLRSTTLESVWLNLNLISKRVLCGSVQPHLSGL